MILAGVVLLALYFRYATGWNLSVKFWTLPFSGLQTISGTEMRFWMVHSLLLVPGALLIGWGLADQISARARRAIAPAVRSAMSIRQAGLIYFIFLFVLYSVIRVFVMLDAPITDNEPAIRFGAQVWLGGELTTARPLPEGAFENLFTWSRGDQITSFDWPGSIAFEALAIATRLDSLLYTLAAAATGWATAAAAHRWLGAKAAVLAAVVWLMSPMALTLSVTGHPHVVSRLAVALALYFVAVADTTDRPGWLPGIGIGFAAGIGVSVRPLETTAVLAPVALWLVLRAVRRDDSKTAISAVLALLPFIALHALYNHWITGHAYLPPRFDFDNNVANMTLDGSVVSRIAGHLTHNGVLFVIFCIGPIATAVAALAVRLTKTKKSIAILLSACTAGALLLTLAHDDTGVHSVGPIHFSEAVVPLILLFVFAVRGAFDRIASAAWRNRILGVLVAYLAIGIGLFSIHQLSALGRQASMTLSPYTAASAEGVENAVVIADLRTEFYWPETGGSWVLAYPTPSPKQTEDVIFVGPKTPVRAVRQAYPTRTVWRLRLPRESGLIEFTKLAEPSSKP